ncbi:hypothetical protein SYJ56_04465 [Algoriphagus sp. D3-2-R+10]|uniref:hypothetical protein n=1 Tax=Algoriphagus aurantiacus TaxID=3103948 RepID=UPI002B3685E2|nr:hypothetical protein [Algoriphagus sp. D3-2-R+10]
MKNTSDSATVAFGFTNESGQFEIEFNSEVDSVLLIINAMTIQKKEVLLSLSGEPFVIEVESSSLDLEEVTVGGIKNPVTKRNDTISYDISGFSTVNDRVLSDVLKRLPGIEVLSNGMIQYQGRPLVKFYIEGLDLLQGRYNLANKNLPVDAVESVEVLENHQPIKILDSLVFSDRAALNVKLKRKNTWIGSGYAGIGGSPFLTDSKVSPMVFKEGFQALFSIQGNNVGASLEDEQKTLTIDDLFDLVNKRTVKEWFNFPTLEMAGFPKERARFNESYLGSANVLTKNSKGIEFRLNVGFNQEDISQKKDRSTTYFLPDADTITFVENTKWAIRRKKVIGELNWNRNVSSSYFDNTTSFDFLKNEFGGNVFYNQSPINGSASLPVFQIENKLKLLTPIKNKLFDLRSTFSFQKSQQLLNLDPPIFDNISHSVDSSKVLTQSVDFRRLFLDNSLGLAFKTRNEINIQSSLGLSVLLDNLGSNLSFDSIAGDQLVALERNKTAFANISTNVTNSFEFEKNGFQAKADVPLYVTYINRNNLSTLQSSNFTKIYLEPHLYLKYQITGKVSNTISFKKKNEFGTGEDYYPSGIVTSYRNIDISDSETPEAVRLMLNYGIDYKNPVYGVFFELSASFSKTKKNVITKYILFDSGRSTKSILDFENHTVQRGLSLRGSKYLADIYTTVTMHGSIQFQDFPQLTNEELVDYSNRIYSTGFDIAVKPKAFLGIDFKTGLNIINSLSDHSGISQIRQLNSELGLDLFPLKNHLLRSEFQYVSSQVKNGNSPQSSSFLDITYRFTIPKTRMDFSVTCNNILDTDLFSSYFSNGFVLGVQEVPLRPRQYLVKLNFSF